MARKHKRGAKRSKPSTRSRRSHSANPLARERAFMALHEMRSRSVSLTEAATVAHTTPHTVRKYLPRAIVRSPGGRYGATPSDGYTRRMQFLTERGLIAVSVRGSRGASRIAEYFAALDRYLSTGDASAIRKFRGQSLRADKVTRPFLTDLTTLKRLGYAGEVSFEDLYANRA